MERQIGISIPTHNRVEWTLRSFERVLHDDRIGEVVLSDDCSNVMEYAQLLDCIEGMGKVSAYRNNLNLDCYRNKKRAIELSNKEWVILADSDNVFDIDYLDRIFEIDQWEPDTIYAPIFARPHFHYGHFSGLTITKENISEYLDRLLFMTALNTANYFVHKETYLNCWDGSIDPITADTIFHNYNHLKAGGKIKFVPGLEYEHTVHPLSHYKQNAHRSGHLHMQIEHQLRSLK